METLGRRPPSSVPPPTAADFPLCSRRLRRRDRLAPPVLWGQVAHKRRCISLRIPVILRSDHLLDIVWPTLVRGAYACLPQPVDTEKLPLVMSEAISVTGSPRSIRGGDVISHMLDGQRHWSRSVAATDNSRSDGLTEREEP